MTKIPLFRLSEIMNFWNGANQGDYYSSDIEELLIEVSEYDFTDVKDDLITSLKSFMEYEKKLELQNKYD
ncbi:hypothetical protein [Campylobacter vicugnae]|uniref:Uncharacterized protein n=1 Tax=Campylobacter vicugnae TaxID=1660076 RepID=A0ABZ2E6I7_9BACT|nr:MULTISPECIES: hypothetical protein [unclassified Campylobacter]